MRILVVGDVHGKAGDLADCRALGWFIEETAAKVKPDRILFLGDQYDTHAMVHILVQEFWLNLFANLAQIAKVVALVGNHDLVGNGVDTAANSMQVHHPNVRVVDGVQRDGDDGEVCYAAYKASLTNISKTKYLFCHHTFQGAQYENGFYAKDGIDPASVPAEHIISGHIHSPSSFGKVTYIGAPRWQTVADASVTRRSICLLDTKTGIVESFATNPHVRVIHHLADTEAAPAVVPILKPQDSVVVDVVGSAKYVEERAKELKAAGHRVRTFATSVSNREVKESEGLGKSWYKYVESYYARYGTSLDTLAKMAEEINVR